MVFLADGHLSRLLRQSRLSANDKGENEMKPEVLNRSLGIYLMAEENPEPQIGDLTMLRLKWGPFNK